MSPEPMLNTGVSSTPFAGRYAIERELGRGGMATVYLARDLSLDRHVAIKILHRELASHMGSGRFTREISIVSNLKHPGILPLLDSGEVDGVPYFTMPFVEGDTLAHRLAREHQLPVVAAIRYTTELADALAHAHAAGILHRDIKPSNVLLLGDHAVLADFGVARAMDASAHDSLTDSGLAVGTAQYMSPEQASADKLDERSDIYALGCMLYEMLAGSPPFTGATTQAILARHMVDAVPHLRTVRSAVNEATEKVIERSLAKVPADRHATVAEFRDALATAQATPDVVQPQRAKRSTYIASGIAVLATLAVLAWWEVRTPVLDANRIVAFPLRVSAGARVAPTTGEDIATLIFSALDRHGSLRSVDGWQLMSATERTAGIDDKSARSYAIKELGGYYITGTVTPSQGDSAQVELVLREAAHDSTVARGSARALPTDLMRATRLAVNKLLPALASGTGRDFTPAWADRDPGAVTSFLRGEASFRRARYGEALGFFREAIGIDSNFALAAVRGAQAATADHHPNEAAALVQSALGKPMLPQYAAFTRGYAAYLAGDADSAVRELRSALKTDPEMAAAWAQLGETYAHLLPMVSNADSLADVAFEMARKYDPRATHILLHPIEIRLRRGDVNGAAPLIEQFVAGRPDTSIAVGVKTANECVRTSPSSVNWKAAVAQSSHGVMSAGAALGAHGAQPACAIAAYAAVIQFDTAHTKAAGNNRGGALVALVALEVARNFPDSARTRIEQSVARGDGGASMFMWAAPYAPALDSAAAVVSRQDSAKFGPAYLLCSMERCWNRSVYEASRGHADVSTAIATVLAKRVSPDSSGVLRNLAAASAAHAQLARGDSAGARNAFRALTRTPVPSGSSLAWDLDGGLGAERIAFARLLLAANRPDSALLVLSALDAPVPTSFPLYLRASLELRAQAADRLGDSRSAQQYRSRLQTLTRRQGQ